MFPQTHVFFAEKVFGVLSPAQTLGSVFPDIVADFCANRKDSHGRGADLLVYLNNDEDLYNFALGVVTHGIDPRGIDYYGDEHYLSFERGYCFEKGRALIEETIKACNLPPEMGWWKAHNIIEMGIELRTGGSGPYGEILAGALADTHLINKISRDVARFYGTDPYNFSHRIYNFSNYIETFQVTAKSLAARYDVQMFVRHRIHINIEHVAQLILKAMEIISDDFNDFFAYVLSDVQKTISQTLK